MAQFRILADDDAPAASPSSEGGRFRILDDEPKGKQRSDNPLIEGGSAVARGANKSITDFFTMPYDAVTGVMNMGRRAAGKSELELPSTTVRRGLDRLMHKVGLSDDAKMAYESIQEIPEGYRPAAAAGQGLGSIVPGLGITSGIAASGNLGRAFASTTVPKGIADATLRSFPSLAKTEIMSGVGGAATGASAQAMFPNSEVAGDLGNLIGSIGSPFAMAQMRRAGNAPVLDRARDFVETTFKPGGVEDASARFVRKDLRRNGENAEDVLSRTLAAQEPQRAGESLEEFQARQLVGATAAEKSGSPTLMGMSETALGVDQNLAEAVNARRAGMSNALGAEYDAAGFRAPVAPLSEAAQAHQAEITQGIQRTLQDAEAQAQQAMARFPATEGGRADANRAAAAIRRQAREGLDDVEHQLWQRVPLETPAQPANAIAHIEGLDPVERLLVPAGLRGALEEATTADTLKRARSTLLRMARGQNDDAAAHTLRGIANSILEDLSGLPGFEQATQFTRALHTQFGDTFAGKAGRVTAQGAQRIADEEVLTRAASGVGGPRQFRELREGVGPIQGQGPDLRNPMRQAQERFIRDKVAALANNDGFITPAAARQFTVNNRELLADFPEIRRDLLNVRQAVRAREAAAGEAPTRLRSVEQSPLGKIAQSGENPIKAIQDNVLNSGRSEEGYRHLADFARQRGVLDNLRSASIETMFQTVLKPGNKDGRYWSHMQAKVFHSPVNGPDSKPLATIMRETGVLSEEQFNRLKMIVDRGVELETKRFAARKQQGIAPAVDETFDRASRTIGARLSGMLPFGGGSIQTAAIASGAAKSFFEGKPTAKIAAHLTKVLNEEGTEGLVKLLNGAPEPIKFKGGGPIMSGVTKAATVPLAKDEARTDELRDNVGPLIFNVNKKR